MVGTSKNASLHLDMFTPYLRLGDHLFDPSGKNASILYKSVGREEMKKYLFKTHTKEQVINMLLDFVENGEDYQNATA